MQASIADVQASLYPQGQGPPIYPHSDDPQAKRPPRRRRQPSPFKQRSTASAAPLTLSQLDAAKRSKSSAGETTASADDDNNNEDKLAARALPASHIPKGFPPELVFRALAAYATLRTLSRNLRLSPFTVTAFLRALYLPFPNRLLGHVHVKLLRILLLQLQMGYTTTSSSSSKSGRKATTSTSWLVSKRRKADGLKWPLRAGDSLAHLTLDTWPVFYDDYCHLTADTLYLQLYEGKSLLDFRCIITERSSHPESGMSSSSSRKKRKAVRAAVVEEEEDEDDEDDDEEDDEAVGKMVEEEAARDASDDEDWNEQDEPADPVGEDEEPEPLSSGRRKKKRKRKPAAATPLSSPSSSPLRLSSPPRLHQSPAPPPPRPQQRQTPPPPPPRQQQQRQAPPRPQPQDATPAFSVPHYLSGLAQLQAMPFFRQHPDAALEAYHEELYAQYGVTLVTSVARTAALLQQQWQQQAAAARAVLSVPNPLAAAPKDEKEKDSDHTATTRTTSMTGASKTPGMTAEPAMETESEAEPAASAEAAMASEPATTAETQAMAAKPETEPAVSAEAAMELEPAMTAETQATTAMEIESETILEPAEAVRETERAASSPVMEEERGTTSAAESTAETLVPPVTTFDAVPPTESLPMAPQLTTPSMPVSTTVPATTAVTAGPEKTTPASMEAAEPAIRIAPVMTSAPDSEIPVATTAAPAMEMTATAEPAAKPPVPMMAPTGPMESAMPATTVPSTVPTTTMAVPVTSLPVQTTVATVPDTESFPATSMPALTSLPKTEQGVSAERTETAHESVSGDENGSRPQTHPSVPRISLEAPRPSSEESAPQDDMQAPLAVHPFVEEVVRPVKHFAPTRVSDAASMEASLGAPASLSSSSVDAGNVKSPLPMETKTGLLPSEIDPSRSISIPAVTAAVDRTEEGTSFGSALPSDEAVESARSVSCPEDKDMEMSDPVEVTGAGLPLPPNEQLAPDLTERENTEIVSVDQVRCTSSAEALPVDAEARPMTLPASSNDESSHAAVERRGSNEIRVASASLPGDAVVDSAASKSVSGLATTPLPNADPLAVDNSAMSTSDVVLPIEKPESTETYGPRTNGADVRSEQPEVAASAAEEDVVALDQPSRSTPSLPSLSQPTPSDCSSSPRRPFDAASTVNAFIRGEALPLYEGGAGGELELDASPADSEARSQDDGFVDHWPQFQAIKRIRRGVPYHMLPPETKLEALEFLIDELLSVDFIAAEFSQRRVGASHASFSYGLLPSEEELENLENADECGVCGSEGDLLCCDGCISSYHRSCIDMSQTASLPPGRWHCPECTIRDPAMIGPLRAGRKDCLDWFTSKELEHRPASASYGLVPFGMETSAGQLAAVPPENEAEFLVVDGFVFRRERFSGADKERKPHAPLDPKELHSQMMSLGESKCSEWPLSQIPCSPKLIWTESNRSSSSFQAATKCDPSFYENQYRKAPTILKPVKKGEDGALRDCETRCALPMISNISRFLTFDVSSDKLVADCLRRGRGLFDPSRMVLDFLASFESRLSRASLLDERQLAPGDTPWRVTLNRKGRSVNGMANLLLRLVDATHPRAFDESWYHPAMGKVTSNIDTGEQGSGAPVDQAMGEAKRRLWERAVPSSIVRLAAKEGCSLNEWIRRVRPDLVTNEVRRDKRKQFVVSSRSLVSDPVKPPGLMQRESPPQKKLRSGRRFEPDGTAMDESQGDAEVGEPLARKEQKARISDIVDNDDGPFIPELHWPLAGRRIIDPVGYLPPSAARYLGRNAGGALAPFVTYSAAFEVGQVSCYHVWRKRVGACRSFEELLLAIRILEDSVDDLTIKRCTTLTNRFGKQQPNFESLCEQRDPKSGVHYHLIGRPGRSPTGWMSSLSVDLAPLVHKLVTRREQHRAELRLRLKRKQDAEAAAAAGRRAKAAADAKASLEASKAAKQAKARSALHTAYGQFAGSSQISNTQQQQRTQQEVYQQQMMSQQQQMMSQQQMIHQRMVQMQQLKQDELQKERQKQRELQQQLLQQQQLKQRQQQEEKRMQLLRQQQQQEQRQQLQQQQQQFSTTQAPVSLSPTPFDLSPMQGASSSLPNFDELFQGMSMDAHQSLQSSVGARFDLPPSDTSLPSSASRAPQSDVSRTGQMPSLGAPNQRMPSSRVQNQDSTYSMAGVSSFGQRNHNQGQPPPNNQSTAPGMDGMSRFVNQQQQYNQTMQTPSTSSQNQSMLQFSNYGGSALASQTGGSVPSEMPGNLNSLAPSMSYGQQPNQVPDFSGRSIGLPGSLQSQHGQTHPSFNDLFNGMGSVDMMNRLQVAQSSLRNSMQQQQNSQPQGMMQMQQHGMQLPNLQQQSMQQQQQGAAQASFQQPQAAMAAISARLAALNAQSSATRPSLFPARQQGLGNQNGGPQGPPGMLPFPEPNFR